MNAGFGSFPNQGASSQNGFNFSAPKNTHFQPFNVNNTFQPAPFSSAPFGTNNFQPNEFQKDRIQPKSAFGSSSSAFTPFGAAPSSAFGAQQPAQLGAQQATQPGQPSKRGQSKNSTKPPKSKGSDSAEGSHTKKRGRNKQRIDFPRFSPGQFVHRQRPNLQSDKDILKPLPKPLTSVSGERDDWDVHNQAAMAQIEQQYLHNQVSLQSAYESMAKMRDTERKEMEKRGLVDSTETRKQLTDAIQFVGSCLEMCPVFERVRRAHENNVFQLEKENDRAVQSRAVKAFSRPAAGQPPPLPSDVRPPSVLVSTLQYLVKHVLPKLPASHAFLWDRTRSIRQDFTYQNYQGKEAIWCFEVIARIHCVSLHVMAAAAANGTAEWSQQQELEQFNKCLQSLSEFYNREGGTHPNEPEIRAYQLLSHFFDDEMAANIDRLPVEISRHALVNLALELRSVSRVSAAKFFARVRQPDVPPAFRAICETHYNALRMQAFRNLCESMHKRMSMYSFRRFMALLGFESEEEARLFCSHYDVLISVSAEAGEEVDVRSWEESNVRDKQALPQPHDSSLNSLIANVDVLKPLMPLRFNPAAAPFKPQASQSFATTTSGTTTTNTTTNNLVAEDQDSRQQAERARAIAERAERARQAAQAEQAAQVAQAERAEQARRREQEAEQARQAAAAQQEEARKRLQQQRIQQEQQRKLQQEQEQQRLQQQRLQKQQEAAQAQRQAQRTRFVESTARSLLENLFNSVCESESAKLVEAARLGKRRILKAAICKMKWAAEASLREENERRMRDQELRAFFNNKGRKRVLSQRLRAEEEPNNSSHMDYEYDAEPHADSHQTGMDEGGSTMITHEPDSEIEPLHITESLAREFRRANECGLDRIRFSADWNSEQGKWLSRVIDFDSPVVPGFYFTKTNSSSGYDVVITDAGYTDPLRRANTISIITEAIAARSRSALISSVRHALNKFTSTLADDLYSHRALNIKLRRISRPAVPQPAASQSPPPTATTSEKSVSALAQRLRDVIAETNKLVQD